MCQFLFERGVAKDVQQRIVGDILQTPLMHACSKEDYDPFWSSPDRGTTTKRSLIQWLILVVSACLASKPRAP